MSINIGLSEAVRKKSAERLNCVLVEGYELYLMTQHYHWNVRGFGFYTLHDLFGRQYQEISKALDDIAERIRALGFYIAIDTSQFNGLSFSEKNMQALKAEDMIKNLLSKREDLVQKIRAMLEDVKEDEVTSDLLVGRLSVHDSAIWGLRSLLDD